MFHHTYSFLFLFSSGLVLSSAVHHRSCVACLKTCYVIAVVLFCDTELHTAHFLCKAKANKFMEFSVWTSSAIMKVYLHQQFSMTFI